jgi:hypothetical protein
VPATCELLAEFVAQSLRPPRRVTRRCRGRRSWSHIPPRAGVPTLGNPSVTAPLQTVRGDRSIGDLGLRVACKQAFALLPGFADEGQTQGWTLYLDD